jgi:aryl-alcohol dehydrogenase-like predicted oxidoreductase
MEYKKLGGSDLNVSTLCLGTMTFGEQNSEADAHAQLDMAVAQGVNFIDTAEMYPVAPRAATQGLTESYIGSWLKHRQRDQLIVASKITGPSRGFAWIRNGPRINREHLQSAIDGSLRRLQTDYLDLYQIHWPDRYVPMFGATTLQQLKENLASAEVVLSAEVLEQIEAVHKRYPNPVP